MRNLFKYLAYGLLGTISLTEQAFSKQVFGWNKFIYVLCPASNNVFQGTIQSDGSIKPLSTPLVDAQGIKPGYSDIFGSILYLGNVGGNTSSMFQINTTSGQLTPMPEYTLNLTNQAIDLFNAWRTPNDKFGFITGSASNSIALYKVDPKTSALTINKTAMYPDGKVIDRGIGTTHIVVTDQVKKGKIYAYVDAAASNSITIYDVDQNTGDLIPRDVTVSTNGVGSRNNKIVQRGSNFYLYVINEQSNNISAFKILPDGNLEFMELVPTGVNPIFSVLKDNKYLYLANKAENSISMFEVKDNGHLEGIINPATGNNRMQTQGVEPFISNIQGDYLYVPCRASNTINIFKIESNGLLKFIESFDLNKYGCYDSFIVTSVTY